MKVKVSEKELELLSSKQFLPDSLLAKILEGASSQDGRTHTIDLSDHEADLVRDYCGERLQSEGFDESYHPTQEGRLLESLIDKLFVK
jgi:hypothetical protein